MESLFTNIILFLIWVTFMIEAAAIGRALKVIALAKVATLSEDKQKEILEVLK